MGVKLNVGSGPYVAPGWVSIDGSWQAWFAAHPLFARAASVVAGRRVGGWPRGIVCCNLRRGLPYAEGTVDAVYASHVLEHLYRNEAVHVLAEARRVLKPGGVCRVVVPDVDAIVGWYSQNKSDTSRSEPSSDLLMKMMCVSTPERPNGSLPYRIYGAVADTERHKWMYDIEGLKALFRDAGFAQPESRNYLQSAIGDIDLVEKPERLLDGAGICVEAVK